MSRILQLTVPQGAGKIRLDKFLSQSMEGSGTGASQDEVSPEETSEDYVDDEPCNDEAGCARESSGISREGIKRLIAKGLCLVNGRACTSASQKLKTGDTVEIELANEESGLVPEEGEVTILHEDADVLVCAKEAGLTVHPCPSCPSNTLIGRLYSRYPELGAMGGLRPGIVHRLDKETSGLLVVARNERARLFLTKAFAERKVRKIYLAIVAGKAPETGSCEMSIGRDPVHKTRMACVPVSQGGREARTTFERLWVAQDESASLVRVHIHTGRTHQIRVHMAHLGHPLLGDATYAPSAIASLAPRVMLHAFSLTVPHPAGGKDLSFTLPPPEDFATCLQRLSFATQTLVVTGNPGSGKSLVLRMFARLGIPTISADELVQGYYKAGGEVSEWLSRRLGSEILGQDGCVVRNSWQPFQGLPICAGRLRNCATGWFWGTYATFLPAVRRRSGSWQLPKSRSISNAAGTRGPLSLLRFRLVCEPPLPPERQGFLPQGTGPRTRLRPLNTGSGTRTRSFLPATLCSTIRATKRLLH